MKNVRWTLARKALLFSSLCLLIAGVLVIALAITSNVACECPSQIVGVPSPPCNCHDPFASIEIAIGSISALLGLTGIISSFYKKALR